MPDEDIDAAYFNPGYVGPGKAFYCLHKSIHTLRTGSVHEVVRSYYIPTRFQVQYGGQSGGSTHPVLFILKHQIWVAVYLLDNDGSTFTDDIHFICNTVWTASE